MAAEVPLADPARPAPVLDQAFDAGMLHLLRAAVLAQATAAGMPEQRAADVMIAVHELASNAVRHGAGTGRLQLRAAAGELVCQVADGDPPAPDGRPGTNGEDGQDGDGTGSGRAARWPSRQGHGLWLVQQVTSRMSVLSGPGGSRVVAVFALPAAQAPG